MVTILSLIISILLPPPLLVFQTENVDNLVHILLKNRIKLEKAEPKNEEEPQENNEESIKSSKKKKKKSKKKKKKKVAEPDVDDSNSCCGTKIANEVSKKSILFSNVSVREHRRCLGLDGVPFEGGWPLGLSNEVVREYNVLGGVDEFEHQKQIELKKRWKKAVESLKKEDEIEPIDENRIFETRQYDYKRPHKHKASENNSKQRGRSGSFSSGDDLFNGKNPLFKSYNEDVRKRVIMRDHCITKEEIEKGFPEEKKTPYPSEQKQKQKKDKKSTSTRRTRSQSQSAEYEGTPFTSFDIRHIRNDLEQTRNNRSTCNGCSCRKPHFYLPHFIAQNESSSSNPAGKQKGKHQHKLNDRRLKEELRKRGKLKPNLTRAEMEIALGSAIENGPCCWSNDCDCVKNGIECQADTCSCWYPSHQSNKNIPVNELPPISVIQATCGNKNGMYVVDYDNIRTFRKTLLCQDARE